MDGIAALQKDAMETTKCALCNNYLSVPPIIAISADGKEYKCGRCEQVKCNTVIRNYCFENVAKFLTFPCTYKGCEEKIQWGNVEEHEKICPYRIISCPIMYECTEMIKVSELKAHFRRIHDISFQTIVCNIEVGQYLVRLLIVNGQQYIIYIFFSYKYSFVNVFSIAPLKVPRKFSVKLTSTTSNSSVLYENQNVIFYDERRYCYDCFVSNCSKKYHPYSKSSMNSNIQMNFTQNGKSLKYSSIMELLEQPTSVTFEISLEPEDTKTELQLPEKDIVHVPLESKQLTICQKDLLCSICQDYMILPIYTCKTGHAICKPCKTISKICPTCQADISDTRCFNLEAITEYIEVPCIYQDEGCTFVEKIPQVVCHEEICSFSENLPAVSFIRLLWKPRSA